MYSALLFSALLLLRYSHLAYSTKWLVDIPGFNEPSIWLNDYLPCARENVIFPETYQALLALPEKVNVGGFILPKDGAILLMQESTITLGGDSHERNCNKGKAYLREPTIQKWFNPLTWRSSKVEAENTAIPDMERVPCNNESVVIKSSGALAFDLEYVPFLRLGQLSFAGSLLSKDYLKELLYTDLGQFLFKNQAGVNVEYYHNDVCGCHKDFSTFTEPICHNIMDTCPIPHCLVPIFPYGSCCGMCGSTMTFAVEYCENERLHLLMEIIKKGVKEKSLEDDLNYYVNYVSSDNYGVFLQTVIIDRNSYSEKSIKFMKYLNETTDWRKKLKLEANHPYGFEFSGRPYNPNVTFGSMILIVLCLVFVSIVALVIFAHYNPENHYLHYIPQYVYDPRLWRIFVNRSNNVFARFDNSRASIQTMTAESNKKYALTMGYDSKSEQVREQAFDNPMYAETPTTSEVGCKEKAQKVVKKEEEIVPRTQDVPQLIIESDVMVDCPEMEEEQELTEIKLESSSEEDEDHETKQ